MNPGARLTSIRGVCLEILRSPRAPNCLLDNRNRRLTWRVVEAPSSHASAAMRYQRIRVPSGSGKLRLDCKNDHGFGRDCCPGQIRSPEDLLARDFGDPEGNTFGIFQVDATAK